MTITIPELSLVALIGPTGSGKSTFARKHFKPTEVLSSDYCRGLVSDDENSQAATNDAFDVLYYIARKRLAAGKLTVIDATNVQPEARKPIVALAREYHCLPVALTVTRPPSHHLASPSPSLSSKALFASSSFIGSSFLGFLAVSTTKLGTIALCSDIRPLLRA